MIMSETALGRMTGKSPVGAFTHFSRRIAVRTGGWINAVIPILIKVTEAADPAVLTVVCRVLAAAFIIDITVYRIMKSREDEARQSRP